MSFNDKKKYTNNSEKKKKIKENKNDELNKECFDCGSCNPEYISINNGVFICEDCLYIHNKFPKQISTTLKKKFIFIKFKRIKIHVFGRQLKTVRIYQLRIS